MTKRQQQILDAYIAHGSYNEAARRLKTDRRYVARTIQSLEARGEVPWQSPAPSPDHLEVGKRTVQYNADGQVVQEWRRLFPEHQAIRDFVDGLCHEVKGKGKVPVRKARKTDTDDLLFELDIYDAHVGMYADEKETRDENYDCDIAAARMVEAAEGLAARSRRPAKCVLVFGGDMMHSDNRRNQTEASGHVLDVDTRYHRVVQYLIKACREVVQIAATIAAEVEVVVLEGNHSWHSEVWLARVLEAYYSDCSNVKVVTMPSPRKHLVWGDNLLVWTHGDRVAAPKWPMIIAAEFAKEWGKTKYRHLKMGHVHHKKTIAPVVIDEQSGLVVEYLEALCATDAWHSGAGFIGSQKGASAFEYHKTKGLITRYYQPV
jgi:hypothetical protein